MFPVVTSDKKTPKTLPHFVVASNGIFLRKQSALGVSVSKVDHIAHLPTMEQDLEYTLPTIPEKVSAQIGGFLRMAWKKHHSEGAVLLCLDENKDWQIVIPRQKVGGADVKYFIDEDTIPEGWQLLGTVHSHPFGGTPRASVTDETDEKKFDGVHLVAGDVDRDHPIYSAVVVVDGVRWLFNDWRDIIAETPSVDVPEEWAEKIDKPFLTKVVGAVTGGWNNNYGYGSGSNVAWDGEEKIREGETAEQALRRARKYSLQMIEETCAKIGYKFEWSLTEDESDATPPPPAKKQKLVFDSGPAPATASTHTPYGGLVTPSPKATVEEPETLWQDAVVIECTGKHKGMDCKKHCGCHCDACKNKLVGSFAPLGGMSAEDAALAELIQCECEQCWNGCTDTVYEEDAEEGKPCLCAMCKRGVHYEDYAAKIVQ